MASTASSSNNRQQYQQGREFQQHLQNIQPNEDPSAQQDVEEEGEISQNGGLYPQEFLNNPNALNYESAMRAFCAINSDGFDGNSLEAVRTLEERLKFISLLDQQEQELQAKILQQQEQLRHNQEQQKQQQQQIQRQQMKYQQEQSLNQVNLEQYQQLSSSSSPQPSHLETSPVQMSQKIPQSNMQGSKNSSNSNKKQATNATSSQQQSPSQQQDLPVKNYSQVTAKVNSFSKTPLIPNSTAQSKKKPATNHPSNTFINPSLLPKPKEPKNPPGSEDIQCSFHPKINSKSKKLAGRTEGSKDYSVRYLYEDFLLRKEKETKKREEELALAEAKRTTSKIDAKSQRIILSKIDRALSGIIESLQEGDYLSYQNLAVLYQQVSLFSAFQPNVRDQDQTSLYLKDRKQLDVARLNAEINFHQQSYKILSLATPEQGIPKKLAFDFLMVLFETKIQPIQTVQILTDILLAQIGIDSQQDSQADKDAFIKALLSQNLPQQQQQQQQQEGNSNSAEDNWDLNQLVMSFRKLYSDKTSIMEWYASKNNNILGDAGQNNTGNKNSSNSIIGKNNPDAEFKFHPEINKKSKLLDQCLLNARENQQNSSMTNEKNNNNNSSSQGNNSKSRFQLLYEHSKYLEQKKQEIKEIAVKEEQMNCTFKPAVNPNRKAFNGSQIQFQQNQNLNENGEENGIDDSQQQAQQQSIHERLYQRHSKKCEIIGGVIQAAEAEKQRQELQECTFKPNINYSTSINSQSNNFSNVAENAETATVGNIKGVVQQLERLQKARAVQLEKDSFFERQRQTLSAGYSRFTETMPFSFDTSNNGITNKSTNSFSGANNLSALKREREIIGNVDVNFSKGKKGRIIVYKGDNPEELAVNFSKIYSLSDEMKSTLTEMLAGYIQRITAEKDANSNQIQEVDGKSSAEKQIQNVAENQGESKSTQDIKQFNGNLEQNPEAERQGNAALVSNKQPNQDQNQLLENNNQTNGVPDTHEDQEEENSPTTAALKKDFAQAQELIGGNNGSADKDENHVEE